MLHHCFGGQPRTNMNKIVPLVDLWHVFICFNLDLIRRMERFPPCSPIKKRKFWCHLLRKSATCHVISQTIWPPSGAASSAVSFGALVTVSPLHKNSALGRRIQVGSVPKKHKLSMPQIHPNLNWLVVLTCFNHLEKIIVNGKDYPIYYGK